jgi:hypothetical protein
VDENNQQNSTQSNPQDPQGQSAPAQDQPSVDSQAQPVDVNQLTQFADGQVAQRPEEATPFTQGQAIDQQIATEVVSAPVQDPVTTDQAPTVENTEEKPALPLTEEALDKVATENQAQGDSEDPLKKLLRMVKGDEAEVDIKKVFIVTRFKLSNEVLQILVKKLTDDGLEPKNIINFILRLDQMVENGEVDEEFFNSFSE